MNARSLISLATLTMTMCAIDSGTQATKKHAANALPNAIIANLDRRFPGWSLAIPMDEVYDEIKKVSGATREQLCVGTGDFDGNGQRDYAVLFVPYASSNLANVAVFLRKGTGYRHQMLTRSEVPGRSTLHVAPAGTKDYDYTNKCDIVYRLATVQIYLGMGGDAYVYKRGKFIQIVCSD